eukprot:10948544-Alexandrium_andersonii.AAC.1
MSASLVGSEMCIRDSFKSLPEMPMEVVMLSEIPGKGWVTAARMSARAVPCLLYTSDAADDM